MKQLVIIGCLLVLPTAFVFGEDGFTVEQLSFFETKIRPALVQYCYECHKSGGDADTEGGLELDHRAGFLKGGDSGAAIVAGYAEKSLLIRAISYADSDLAMPPEEKLPAQVIRDFRNWVEQGAAWPMGEEKRLGKTKQWHWDELRKSHWAWHLEEPKPPQIKNTNWVTNGIDRFVLAKLESKGMQPAEIADKRTLMRRIYLDLIGLPPTRQQVSEFVTGAKSWNDVIEDVLSSPQYGERWGRHWLDVARYSDGYGGFLDNALRPNAWRYRDWVVYSLNENMPIDRFLRLQIAGDLIEPESHAVATGFFALGPNYNSDGGDPDSVAIAKIETLDDRVDTLSRGLLGVTLSCARCHDHKFDPIPTMDYYSIAGIFNNSVVHDRPLVSTEKVQAYKAGQSRVRQLRDQQNHWMNDQKTRIQLRELRRVGQYMRVARDWEVAKREDEFKGPIGEFAEARGLFGPLAMSTSGYFLADTDKLQLPQLDRWFQEKSDRAAEEFETWMVGLLDKKVAGEREYEHQLATAADDTARQQIKKPTAPKTWIETWDKKLRNRFNLSGDWTKKLPEKLQADKRQLEIELKQATDSAPPMYAVAHTLRDAGSRNMNIALRGNLRKPGEEAPRRFLRLLAGEDSPNFTKGSGRLELAQAVTSGDVPLTSRVFVNRVWGWHFGEAIVPSRSNFGSLGQKPSHPKLLDWLAVNFIADGWSLKNLHRLILRSSTWRMSSQFDRAKFAKDAQNRMLWRQNPRKLEVEAWRDSLLFVSGDLNLTMGGAPFDDLTSEAPELRRRTLYAKTSRNGDKFKSDRFLQLFDFPAPRSSIARRVPTITPQQSLFVLNHPFAMNRARSLAKRMEAAATDLPGRVAFAYETLFARLPTKDESTVAATYLDPSQTENQGLTRLERYAQALLASNEFFFVE